MSPILAQSLTDVVLQCRLLSDVVLQCVSRQLPRLPAGAECGHWLPHASPSSRHPRQEGVLQHHQVGTGAARHGVTLVTTVNTLCFALHTGMQIPWYFRAMINTVPIALLVYMHCFNGFARRNAWLFQLCESTSWMAWLFRGVINIVSVVCIPYVLAQAKQKCGKYCVGWFAYLYTWPGCLELSLALSIDFSFCLFGKSATVPWCYSTTLWCCSATVS